jgi:hypothetical protein
MFTIKELEDRWNDYESACLFNIKELLKDKKEIIFESDDLGTHPVCIGDNGEQLIDGIINRIYLDDDSIYITYQDRDYPDCIMDEEIQYLNHINYIDLIYYIKEYGETNLG